MRILVYPHDLGIGGSQINAIECAAAVRDLGHDVVIFGQSGPLKDMIATLRLPFVESPPVHRRPTPGVISALRRTVRDRRIQVLHGYEWPPVLECYLAARQSREVAVVGSIMSMSVAPFIPVTVPLLVGTQQIAAAELAAGRGDVTVVEPPVDVVWNSGKRRDLGVPAFLERWDIDPRATKVVIVSRLAHEMKLEGILAAISTVSGMATEQAMQLIIVGDGPAAKTVREAARQANERARRRIVVTTGAMRDPRPAYAAADICLGMGSSILRGMAFGKPVVVQGENGFWRLLTPGSLDQFLWQGWFGVGMGQQHGEPLLTEALGRLMSDAQLRERLGAFGRKLAVDRFSMASAARAHWSAYRRSEVGEIRSGARWRAELVSTRRFVGYTLRRAVTGLRGESALDDFNAAPVAAAVPLRNTAGTA